MTYRKHDACARCGAPIDKTEAYLSGDGAICERCHKETAIADKQRRTLREENSNVLLYGVLSMAAGLGLLGTGLFATHVLIPGHPLAVAFVAFTNFRAFQLQDATARGRFGRMLAIGGATLGVVGILVLLSRR